MKKAVVALALGTLLLVPGHAVAAVGAVSTFTPEGTWLASFPVGLAAGQYISFVERDASGRIYVGRVDSGHGTNQFNPNDMIAVFDASGNLLSTIKGSSRNQNGLAFDSLGNLYFGGVPDGGPLGNNLVYRFTAAGVETSTFGLQLNDYSDFVTAPGDRLFAMRFNDRDILEFTTAGAQVNAISLFGRFGSALAIDEAGASLWAYEPQNGGNPPGNLLVHYDLGLNELGTIDLEELDNPSVVALEVNADGELLLLLYDARDPGPGDRRDPPPDDRARAPADCQQPHSGRRRESARRARQSGGHDRRRPGPGPRGARRAGSRAACRRRQASRAQLDLPRRSPLCGERIARRMPAVPTSTPHAAVILAAGQGKRMQSSLPKVLHEVAGRPMLARVLEVARAAGCDPIVAIVGHGGDQVRAALESADVVWAEQREQRGTGHAVAQAAPALGAESRTILILSGDVPLVRPETLSRLVEAAAGAWGAMAVATLSEPGRLGRVIARGDGTLERIVEAADATPEELKNRRINAGLYALPSPALFSFLAKLEPANAQGELYLTDALGDAVQAGHRIALVELDDPDEALGVNDREDLARVQRLALARGWTA